VSHTRSRRLWSRRSGVRVPSLTFRKACKCNIFRTVVCSAAGGLSGQFPKYSRNPALARPPGDSQSAELAIAALTIASMESEKTIGATSDSAPRPVEPGVLTAGEAAELLRVQRAWVYAHAHELGGWRLLGKSGPWRFARDRLLQAGQASPPVARRGRSVRRAARPQSAVALLPVRPRRAIPR
jgi:hypothetical protein